MPVGPSEGVPSPACDQQSVGGFSVKSVVEGNVDISEQGVVKETGPTQSLVSLLSPEQSALKIYLVVVVVPLIQIRYMGLL